MADPQWIGFAGLTGIVLFAFLSLARLSQGRVSDSDTESDDALDRLEPTPTAQPATVDDRLAVPDAPTSTDPGVTSESTPPEATVPASTLDFDQQSDDRTDLDSLPTSALLVNVALTQGLFAVVLLGGAFVFAIPPVAFGAESVLSDAIGMPMVIGIALGVALWTVSELGGRVVDAAGIEHDESLRELLTPESATGWVILLGGVLPVIAGVEELVFRAAAIGALSMGLGISPWTLAVVSSFIFALGHGAQGPAGLVITGLLGFVLATAFVLTGSLLTVIVAHYLVNALEFVVHEGLDSVSLGANPDGS